MTVDSQNRRKKNPGVFNLYISKGVREEVEEADNYFESKSIDKSEQYIRGYLNQYHKAKEAEGIISPMDGYYEKKDEEYSRRHSKTRIRNDILSELFKSTMDPEAEKNVLILATGLDEQDFKLLPPEYCLKIKRIIQKSSQYSIQKVRI